MKYKLRMEIGDPSKDGHNQSKTIYFNSNKSTQELKEAYKRSCNITGLVWTSNEDLKINGKELDWRHPEYKDRQLFAEYESYELSDLAKSILESHGVDTDGEWDSDSVIDLFFDFLKISLPDFNAEFVKDETELLDVTIGYGLFE
jgi:hypothetical protein